jgi:hypothetical protein
MTLEPIGRHLSVIPRASPEAVHGIILAKSLKMRCNTCKGKCLVWNKQPNAMTGRHSGLMPHLIECEACNGSGEIQEKPPITRINYLADVVAVGPEVPGIHPGDCVAVSYWSGRTASGSRILEKSQYGLPAGALICNVDEVVAVVS